MNNKTTKKTITRKAAKRSLAKPKYKVLELNGNTMSIGRRSLWKNCQSAESMLLKMVAASQKNNFTSGVITNPDGSEYRINITQIQLSAKQTATANRLASKTIK